MIDVIWKDIRLMIAVSLAGYLSHGPRGAAWGAIGALLFISVMNIAARKIAEKGSD